jgi:hypothetical protein
MRAHILIGVAALVASTIAAPPDAAADRPAKLTIAIYAPSLELSSGGRLALAKDVAAALERRTGIPTSAKAFTTYRDLVAARPDFAILDPLCIAAHPPVKVIATATIGGQTTRRWGLYARDPVSVDDLAGQKLAYVDTQCRDGDFIDHAVFLGLVRSADHFGGTVTPPDIASALVATRDLKKAAAVIAPAALAGGLELVLAVDAVPNPGLVVMSRSLSDSLIDDAKASVGGATSAPIDGWGAPASYDGLAGRMASRRRTLVMAPPDRAIVSEPEVLRLASPAPRATSAKRLRWAPPPKRRER